MKQCKQLKQARLKIMQNRAKNQSGYSDNTCKWDDERFSQSKCAKHGLLGLI